MDEIDRAQDRDLMDTESAINAARAGAATPSGMAGDCELCGEHSMRLVLGICAPCRDRYRLP